MPNPKWSQNYPIPGQPAWIVGWGVTEEDTILPPDTLRNVRVKIYDGSTCNSVLSEKRKDWSSQICAGDIDGGRDTCQGMRQMSFLFKF